MSRSYYVIELSARWLTVLLVALAVLMVLAFSLGYGAAWSVISDSAPVSVTPTPTPLVTTEVLPEPTSPVPTATPPAARPTSRPGPPTAVPPATATPKPRTTEAPSGDFWVQVMASSKQTTIDEARAKLDRLGFDRQHQRVTRSEVAGGNELFKLRVGPFPDRASADRVLKRMRAADYPDAWVVVP